MQKRIMGKQGPCCHCGISTTPLWRNGPEEKPVLCNACGSRWRTKGTLSNYMPMHSGGLGLKNGSMQKTSQKINEVHPHKRKEPSGGFLEYRFYPGSDYPANSSLDDDDSARLSSGSRISLSESSAKHTPKAGKGTECWPPWGFHVPSKRRTALLHHRHFIKRFSSLPTAESFSCRCTSEEDLLVDYKPLLTTEIGLGGVFIRPSPSRPPAQESQAGSIGYNNNEMHEAVALKATLISEEAKDIPLLDQSIKHKRKEKTNQLARNIGVSRANVSKGWMPNKALLAKFPYNKREVLQSCHSPLSFVELKDIVNYETFMGLLSDVEQQQLVEHVSPIDADSEGLRCMFSCVQFESSLRLFQTLLSEGMFDSDCGLSPGVLQHYRHLLTLSDLRASGWIERCSTFSNRAKRKGVMDYSKITQDKEYLKENMKSLTFMGLNQLLPGDTGEAKHVTAGDFCFVSAEKGKRVAADLDFKAQTSLDSWSMFSDVTYDEKVKSTSRQRQKSLERDSVKGGKKCCMHVNNKNIKPTDRLCPHYQRRERPISSYASIDEAIYGVIQEHDILLDLPSNVSFQQAELLQKPVWTSKLLPREDGIQIQRCDDPIVKNVWSHTEPNSDLTGLWNSPSESVNHTLQ